ncbi:alpha/beta hydrolase [Paraburkholderia sp. XV]|uniref:alpha/beta hydrolase n=1 Tax=Paraburkholderia sp. XV TaxID=2831520 RepID=UPI001CD701AA|nr:alpha/beta hydrolase [Paraburkholderia sp. XV]
MRCVKFAFLGVMVSMLAGCASQSNGGSPNVAVPPADQLPGYELIAPPTLDETGFDATIDSPRGANGGSTQQPSPNAPASYVSAPYKVVPVFFGTDREKIGSTGFGGTRSTTISYGQVSVSIPRDHQMGALEDRSWWSLRFASSPEKDVMVLSISPQSPDAFFAALRAKVSKSPKKSLFVFVHGYHVSFADAARRTAQMAYDLGFDGAPVFFSWPSQDRMLAYMVDEQSIADAEPHLEHFLKDVLKQSTAENVYLIAHSMGNRALTRALGTLAVAAPQEVKRIKEVILAAPDIGTVEFTEQIVPGLRELGAPITLYASSNDRALVLSEQLHGGKRAGESGDHLVVLNGIETIDASNTDTDLVGHSYYGDRRTVLADMWYLINGDMRAHQRCCLKPELFRSRPYWIFLR